MAVIKNPFKKKPEEGADTLLVTTLPSEPLKDQDFEELPSEGMSDFDKKRLAAQQKAIQEAEQRRQETIARLAEEKRAKEAKEKIESAIVESREEREALTPAMQRKRASLEAELGRLDTFREGITRKAKAHKEAVAQFKSRWDSKIALVQDETLQPELEAVGGSQPATEQSRRQFVGTPEEYETYKQELTTLKESRASLDTRFKEVANWVESINAGLGSFKTIRQAQEVDVGIRESALEELEELGFQAGQGSLASALTEGATPETLTRAGFSGEDIGKAQEFLASHVKTSKGEFIPTGEGTVYASLTPAQQAQLVSLGAVAFNAQRKAQREQKIKEQQAEAAARGVTIAETTASDIEAQGFASEVEQTTQFERLRSQLTSDIEAQGFSSEQETAKDIEILAKRLRDDISAQEMGAKQETALEETRKRQEAFEAQPTPSAEQIAIDFGIDQPLSLVPRAAGKGVESTPFESTTAFPAPVTGVREQRALNEVDLAQKLEVDLPRFSALTSREQSELTEEELKELTSLSLRYSQEDVSKEQLQKDARQLDNLRGMTDKGSAEAALTAVLPVRYPLMLISAGLRRVLFPILLKNPLARTAGTAFQELLVPLGRRWRASWRAEQAGVKNNLLFTGKSQAEIAEAIAFDEAMRRSPKLVYQALRDLYRGVFGRAPGTAVDEKLAEVVASGSLRAAKIAKQAAAPITLPFRREILDPVNLERAARGVARDLELIYDVKNPIIEYSATTLFKLGLTKEEVVNKLLISFVKGAKNLRTVGFSDDAIAGLLRKRVVLSQVGGGSTALSRELTILLGQVPNPLQLARARAALSAPLAPVSVEGLLEGISAPTIEPVVEPDIQPDIFPFPTVPLTPGIPYPIEPEPLPYVAPPEPEITPEPEIAPQPERQPGQPERRTAPEIVPSVPLPDIDPDILPGTRVVPGVEPDIDPEPVTEPEIDPLEPTTEPEEPETAPVEMPEITTEEDLEDLPVTTPDPVLDPDLEEEVDTELAPLTETEADTEGATEGVTGGASDTDPFTSADPTTDPFTEVDTVAEPILSLDPKVDAITGLDLALDPELEGEFPPPPPEPTDAPPDEPPLKPPPFLIPFGLPKGGKEFSVLPSGQTAVTWKQGIMWITVYPPYNKESTQYGRTPPVGAIVVYGPKDAARTLQKLGIGVSPQFYLDIGAFIAQVTPQAKNIRFVEDPANEG